MERLDSYNSFGLAGRLSHGEDPVEFIKRLAPTQRVPCPWESLKQVPHGRVWETMFTSREHTAGRWNFPLALELGCGMGFNGVVTGPRIGTPTITLLSDCVPVDSNSPDNYVQIDLMDPNQIDLGGLRCHWISASLAITGHIDDKDPRYGVPWPSREAMIASLHAIMRLLLPHGLLYINPASSTLYEFARVYGFDLFPLSQFGVLLQQRGESI